MLTRRTGAALRPPAAAGVRSLFELRKLEHAHREKRLLKYPASHVYGVVSDVDAYKHFVPWCVDSVVLFRQPNYMEAELAVGFNVFAERYISRVTLDPGRRVVALSRDTQLFHHLRNEWAFEPGPTPGTSWVHFSIDFAFRSRIYAQAAGLFFDEVVAKMVAAFDARCQEVAMMTQGSRRGVGGVGAGGENTIAEGVEGGSSGAGPASLHAGSEGSGGSSSGGAGVVSADGRPRIAVPPSRLVLAGGLLQSPGLVHRAPPIVIGPKGYERLADLGGLELTTGSADVKTGQDWTPEEGGVTRGSAPSQQQQQQQRRAGGAAPKPSLWEPSPSSSSSASSSSSNSSNSSNAPLRVSKDPRAPKGAPPSTANSRGSLW